MEVKELEQYASDERITDKFKDLWPKALKDTVKFQLCQATLPKDRQNAKKLSSLSALLLSRVLRPITDFQDDPETKDLGTGYNWNVILGESTQPQNQQYSIHTGHATMMNSMHAQILYYQKLECTFWNTSGQQKKCECIIYCQKVDHKSVTFSDALERLQ